MPAGDGGDDRGEGGADDDRHRQVDDVASEQELLEVVEHARLPSDRVGWPCSASPVRRAGTVTPHAHRHHRVERPDRRWAGPIARGRRPRGGARGATAPAAGQARCGGTSIAASIDAIGSRGARRGRAPRRRGHRREALDRRAEAQDPREPHEGHQPARRGAGLARRQAAGARVRCRHRRVRQPRRRAAHRDERAGHRVPRGGRRRLGGRRRAGRGGRHPGAADPHRDRPRPRRRRARSAWHGSAASGSSASSGAASSG